MSSSDASADADIAVVTGPTGAGKSAIAMALATHLSRRPVSLISADSRQVYRGFDVGTAKPSPADRSAVPHAGIDVADPTERYSAARWASLASEAIVAARAAGRTPVIVGGTGLYLRALFDGLFPEPPLDPARRRELADELDSWPTERLRQHVATLDPPRAHLGRTQLLRAIEVATLTGVPISEWHRREQRTPRWNPRYLVVDPGQPLAASNERRVDMMLDAGWVDEVRALSTSVPADAPAWKSTGYRTVARLACRDLDPAAAREAIVIETRQYVKRQRTWFRHQLPAHAVTRLDPLAPDRDAVIAAWWGTVTDRSTIADSRSTTHDP